MQNSLPSISTLYVQVFFNDRASRTIITLKIALAFGLLAILTSLAPGAKSQLPSPPISLSRFSGQT